MADRLRIQQVGVIVMYAYDGRGAIFGMEGEMEKQLTLNQTFSTQVPGSSILAIVLARAGEISLFRYVVYYY